MKEIETLVEEKKKDSSDMAKMVTPQDSRFNLPLDSEQTPRAETFLFADSALSVLEACLSRTAT